jgi:excisionase family DNA binding protein
VINAATAVSSEITSKPLTTKDVAALLQVHPKTIERHAREGSIPAHFRLNRWFFFQSELDSWLRCDVDSACQSSPREFKGRTE